MSQDEPSGPDLVGVIADANSAGLEHVVIGGFSVIFHGYVGATRDSDNSRRGIIDIIRGGSPPLDFDTVSDRADTVEWEGQRVRVAALSSVVGFKRLARRPQDRVDLEELEAIHGDLPVEPIPGLDS